MLWRHFGFVRESAACIMYEAAASLRFSPNDSPSFIVSFQDVGRGRLPLRADVRVLLALALAADVKLGGDVGASAESDSGRMRGADNGGGRGALQGDMVSQSAGQVAAHATQQTLAETPCADPVTLALADADHDCTC